jgi:hypothetical protein
MVFMKTTLEIPDPLFRKAKARAAERGQSLKAFVAEALEARLATGYAAGAADDPKWMSGFGKLRQLHDETARVQSVIDDAFESIEDEDLR